MHRISLFLTTLREQAEAREQHIEALLGGNPAMPEHLAMHCGLSAEDLVLLQYINQGTSVP